MGYGVCSRSDVTNETPYVGEHRRHAAFCAVGPLVGRDADVDRCGRVPGNVRAR